MKYSKTILLCGALALCCLLSAIGCGGDNSDDPVVLKVQIPDGIFQKAQMGVPYALTFGYGSSASNMVGSKWFYVRRVSGDASFSADSVQANGSGTATVTVTFDGSQGTALFRIVEAGRADSVEVEIRASTLILGANPQGQYMLPGIDMYNDMIAFNGAPERVDVSQSFWITYAVYESQLGVVFALADVDQDETANAPDSVLGVFVNSVFEGKTSDSIGIGSVFADLTSSLGAPESVEYDPNPPPAWVVYYASQGLVAFTQVADTQAIQANDTIFEIHVSEPFTLSSPAKANGDNNSQKLPAELWDRRRR